jgi:hypothetical protein
MKKIILILILFVLTTSNSFPETLINHDFNDQKWSKLSAGAYWSIQPTGGINNSPAARLHYFESGTWGKSLALDLRSANSNEFWIEFDVKIEGDTSKSGFKFVKLFGLWEGGSENNMTFYVNNGQQNGVTYYGDTILSAKWNGTGTLDRDNSPVFLFFSDRIDLGESWGRWKLWVKRADRGVINGECKVWWNSNLVAHVIHMDSNPIRTDISSTVLEKLEFGGYHNLDFNNPYYFWIDNIYVGTKERRTENVNLLPPNDLIIVR